MTKLLTDEELEAIHDEHCCGEVLYRPYADAIEAAVIAKMGNPLLSDYVEKAIMEDRRKWRALIGPPVAWGITYDKKNIHEVILPEEHIRNEDDYTIPLYKLPKELK